MQRWIFMRAASRLSPLGPRESCVSLTLIILTCWQRATRQRNKETAKSGSPLKFATKLPDTESQGKGPTFTHFLWWGQMLSVRTQPTQTGVWSSLSDWLSHIVLTWQAEVRSGFRSRGFQMEWQRMCCHRAVIYQTYRSGSQWYQLTIMSWESTCKDTLDGLLMLCSHIQLEMLYKTSRISKRVCACNHPWYGYIYKLLLA